MDSDLSWKLRGACLQRDPELFFPTSTAYKACDSAAGVCGQCPVALTCFRYSIEHRIQHGVWGGIGERRRKEILKDLDERRAARAA